MELDGSWILERNDWTVDMDIGELMENIIQFPLY